MGNDGFYVAQLKDGSFAVVVTKETADTVGTLAIKRKPSQDPKDDYRIMGQYDWIPEGQTMYVDVTGWYIVPIEDLGERPVGKLNVVDYTGMYAAFMKRKGILL